ncbi:MAG: hypothetical protein IPK77_16790 [Cellvibrio sp.]|nr:hypothetical protein [Cellvibrio sp.]
MRTLKFTFIFLLVACSLNSEQFRIVIPETLLTLVVEEDEKHMARYHFLAEGKKVSEEGFLGPLMGNLKIAPYCSRRE